MNEEAGDATDHNYQAEDNATAVLPGKFQRPLHVDLEEYEELGPGAMSPADCRCSIATKEDAV